MSRRTPRLSDLIRQPSATPAGPETPETGTKPAGGTAASPISAALRIERSPAEAEARLDYSLLEDWISESFRSARAAARLEAGDILDTIEAVLERPRLLEALFAETFKTRPEGDPLARKSLNVSIYALRLGKAVGLGDEALVVLGAAGLLHKIGLTQVAPNLVTKPGTLTRSELAEVRQHPHYAQQMIAPLGEPFARIGEIVFQANERIDGSGYPAGLRNGDIRNEALIVGLVDVFEALIQPRPWRDRLVPFRAVKEIIERERSRFPRPLLREFIASFSLFPPFTYVRLNSKAIARVEETEAGYPLRPRVTIVIDANGQPPVRPQTVRLRESPLLYITAPIAEAELPA